ncbi:YchJ family protein [Streptomyces sp. NPDC012623]|uniref:YchJ family protein n=1 Tax=unclassified Streptomyces TaxID=2593676 RepID=UPI003697EB18
MARRTSRTVRTAHRAVAAGSPCPCGRSAPHGQPIPYGECCDRFHSGAAAAPSPEALMRSRYSAFVLLDAPYLLRTWDPATRPARLELDPGTRWTGLEILETTDGSAFHTTGTVTFRARFRQDGEPGVLLERSRFVRSEGHWVYVDGTFPEVPE